MIKLKELLKEWTDTSFKDLPKRWSKPVMKGREPDGLTEFERLGGKDNMSIDEKMSDEKRSFLMLINKGKPTLIKKGLKEIKILNKKIEEMIEELI